MQPEYREPTEAELELQRLQEYREVFAQTHRKYPDPPQYKTFNKEAYSFMAIMGRTAVGYAMSAIGSIIYSAIRTSGQFAKIVQDELTANSWNPVLTVALVFVSAAAIISAVEGGLASWGYDRGKESGRIQTNGWFVGAAVLMSALAGLLPSLNVIPDSEAKIWIVEKTLWALGIVSGLGVVPLVIFGAENLGVLDTKWIEFLKNKEDEINQYNKALKEEYQTDIDAWNAEFKEDYRKIGRSALYHEETFTAKRNSPAKKEKKKEVERNVTDEIRTWLKDSGYTPYDVGQDARIKPVQIADALQLEAGSAARKNVSTYILRLKDEYDKGNW